MEKITKTDVQKSYRILVKVTLFFWLFWIIFLIGLTFIQIFSNDPIQLEVVTSQFIELFRPFITFGGTVVGIIAIASKIFDVDITSTVFSAINLGNILLNTSIYLDQIRNVIELFNEVIRTIFVIMMSTLGIYAVFGFLFELINICLKGTKFLSVKNLIFHEVYTIIIFLVSYVLGTSFIFNIILDNTSIISKLILYIIYMLLIAQIVLLGYLIVSEVKEYQFKSLEFYEQGLVKIITIGGLTVIGVQATLYLIFTSIGKVIIRSLLTFNIYIFQIIDFSSLVENFENTEQFEQVLKMIALYFGDVYYYIFQVKAVINLGINDFLNQLLVGNIIAYINSRLIESILMLLIIGLLFIIIKVVLKKVKEPITLKEELTRLISGTIVIVLTLVVLNVFTIVWLTVIFNILLIILLIIEGYKIYLNLEKQGIINEIKK